MDHPNAEQSMRSGAFVQTKTGYELDDEDLTNFCRQHLASYKVPRIWRFVHQFPQTASGKIQKFILRRADPAEDKRARRSRTGVFHD